MPLFHLFLYYLHAIVSVVRPCVYVCLCNGDPFHCLVLLQHSLAVFTSQLTLHAQKL